jgi:hypothetical protein
MRNVIHLSDCPAATIPNDRYPSPLLDQARTVLATRGLRYDNRTGKISDNTGVIEEYVSPSDHVPLHTEEEVMRWNFSRHINNEAGRIVRGAA